jgi:hypothetical protein
MAAVTRSQGVPAKKPVIPTRAAQPQGIQITLPTEPETEATTINDFHVVITGEPGIGKTTLGMQQEGVLLLTFDPLPKGLNALKRYVPTWKHFDAYLNALEKSATANKFQYSRVLIDGVDIWFRGCQAWVCEKLCISHPSEEDWGKAWDLLNQTFSKSVDRLMALPCGVWFICHSKEKEVETRDGTKVAKHAPILTARAEEIVIGRANALFNIRYQGETNRVMRIRGSESVVAKCNIDGHFQTPEGDEVLDVVLGNKGPAEAYRRLVNAFENKQRYTDFDGWRKIVQQNAAKKK